MLAKVTSGCVLGMDACPIDVEVDVANGLPSFSVVGLPDTSIRESRDRIRSAIKNSGFKFPDAKITVNLSPAGMKKEGAGFDLPIAVGILAACNVLSQEDLEGIFFCGELSLNGKLKPFRGALPVVLSLKKRFRAFMIPEKNISEVSNIKGINVFGAVSLAGVVEHIRGVQEMPPAAYKPVSFAEGSPSRIDLRDVKGQEHVKRGLEVAASGRHNVLLIGPPGSGKSMLAKRVSTILTGFSMDEALETTKIYSIAGQLKAEGLLKERPVRAPHHTISYAAMAGGGSSPLPGEISLSHNGVLFLDEFPEFRRDVLEILRQPMETGEITISRRERSVRYPSRFMLVAAMNPCPCGYYGSEPGRCKCTPNQIERYMSKISGPLLDRIDIHIEVPAVGFSKLRSKTDQLNSKEMRQQVTNARAIQHDRFGDGVLMTNSRMSHKQVEKYCLLDESSEMMLKQAMNEFGLSARAHDKICKVARTIADLEGSKQIALEYIAEAISYRKLDRKL